MRTSDQFWQRSRSVSRARSHRHKTVVHVIVDTNILGGADRRPLESNVMRRLLDETRRDNLKLVVPEVVVREAANLWAEKVGEQMRAARSAQLFLLQAGLSADEPFVLRDLKGIRQREELRIREHVTEAGGEVAPLPEAGHDQVIERALRRRQPFDSNGRGGYRDVVLWESLLELDSAQGPVVFLSKDKRAFFEDGKSEKGLAHTLREDADRRLGKDSVALFFDPEQGIRSALTKGVEEERRAAERAADEKALRRLDDLRRSDPAFAEALADEVTDALDFIGLGGDLRPYGVEDGDVYDSHIGFVVSRKSGQFLDAHVVEDGTVLAKLALEVVAIAEATMHPSVAALLEDHWQVMIRDRGLASGMGSAQIELGARVLADLVIDVGAGRLTSPATITRIEPLSPENVFGGDSADEPREGETGTERDTP